MQGKGWSIPGGNVESEHLLHFWSVYLALPQILEKPKNAGYLFKSGSRPKLLCELKV